MADIRINGKRMPALQAVTDVGSLIQKLNYLAQDTGSSLTSIMLNNLALDLDHPEYHKMILEKEDTIDVRLDTAEQLSFESLQVALDMADLLIFDLKVASIRIWDNDAHYTTALDTLLEDCTLFLTLAAKPVSLLGKELKSLATEAHNCLRELDCIAKDLEGATKLAVYGYNKEACYVLVKKVKSSIERWVGLSAVFAQSLDINNLVGIRAADLANIQNVVNF